MAPVPLQAMPRAFAGNAPVPLQATPPSGTTAQTDGAASMTYEPKRADFSIPVRINLYSDTQSKPSRGMKQAMMDADVGDEQGGSDPTDWDLCDRAAQ
jgi:hypothetical protein